jgi:cobalt-zinc-cadmium efflux system membrane fusion protein
MSTDKLHHAPVMGAPAPARPLPARPGTRAGGLRRLAAAFPNLVILVALGALAWWGHHTGWKLPRFSEMTGTAGKEKDDWCAEHGVPESVCVECNPERWPRPKPPEWCRVHGVHECPWEHPEIAQLPAVPTVSPVVLERARLALAFAERPVNSRKCKLFLRRIQFTSEEAVTRAGIDVTPVWEAPITEFVTANGEVIYDQTRVARLSSRVRGSVRRVDGVVGQAVKKGDVLALVDVAEVGKAKAEFLQAVAGVNVRTTHLDRLRTSASAIPEVQIRQGEAALQEAQIRLAGAEQALANLGLPVRADEVKGLSIPALRRRLDILGLPSAVAADLDAGTVSANLLPVRAPLDGVVVAREVVSGEVVDDTRMLFVVADTTRMWLTLHVRPEDTGHLALGQTVRFRPDAGPPPGPSRDGSWSAAGRMMFQAVGRVAWISPAVDRKTRTVQVRAELDNATGRLRDSTFGSGRIILREEPQAVVVPSEAVQWEGDCHVVFVRDRDYLTKNAPKVFHTRTVRLGAKDGDNTEIIAGVLPGELVVGRGSALLRSELLKNSLGEG